MEIKTLIRYHPNWFKRPDTKFVILHHADARVSSVQDIDRWHRNKGWWGCGYHFVVRKDGTIEGGRPVEVQGAHCIDYNHNSIGICFEGDFDSEYMREKQAEAGISLLRDLRKEYKDLRIMRHRDANDTRCPGENFRNDIIYQAMQDKDNKLKLAQKYIVKQGEKLDYEYLVYRLEEIWENALETDAEQRETVKDIMKRRG